MQSLESYRKNRRQGENLKPTSHTKWLTPRETTRSIMLNCLLLWRISVIGINTSSNHIILWKYSPIMVIFVRFWVRISSCGGKCDRLSTCLYLIFGFFIAKGPSTLRTVLHVNQNTREMPNWKTRWLTIPQLFKGCFFLLSLR